MKRPLKSTVTLKSQHSVHKHSWQTKILKLTILYYGLPILSKLLLNMLYISIADLIMTTLVYNQGQYNQ